MKNQTEAADAGEPALTILADDLPAANAKPGVPTELEKSMGAAMGVQISGAVPPTGAVVEFVETKPDIFGRTTGSWIGQFGQSLLNKFLSRHEAEWKDLQAEERDRKETAGMFKFYTKRVRDSQVQLGALHAEFENYKTVSLANTFFQNRVPGGKSFNEILSGQSGVLIQTVFFAQKYGDEVLQLAQAEHAALEKTFLDFKTKKRVTLKSLGLI